jgi:hypothetical protein
MLLFGRVVGVLMDRFAWAGPAELHAEVILDTVEEDRLADALAALLWHTRPATSTPGDR